MPVRRAASLLNASPPKNPSSAAPVMFTVSVPKGNGRPARRVTARSTTKRVTEPMPPMSSDAGPHQHRHPRTRTRRTRTVAKCTTSNPTTMLTTV